MNNACPKCGQVYNVAAKDIGRRIYCKKCDSKLEVRDTGLEYEDAPQPPPPPQIEPDDDDRPRKKKRPPAPTPMELLAKVGGIPTILFGFGIFLVLFTGFQEAIGRAKLDRRQAAIDEVQVKINEAQRKYDEKKEHTDAETKELQRNRESLDKEKKIAEEDRQFSEIANKRGGYMDKYVLMLGFLLIAFGCLGYLIGDFGMVLRIVAAVIVLFMVMALFKQSTGQKAGVEAGVVLG